MQRLNIERSPKPHVVCMTHNDDSVVLEAEETIEKEGTLLASCRALVFHAISS